MTRVRVPVAEFFKQHTEREGKREREKEENESEKAENEEKEEKEEEWTGWDRIYWLGQNRLSNNSAFNWTLLAFFSPDPPTFFYIRGDSSRAAHAQSIQMMKQYTKMN